MHEYEEFEEKPQPTRRHGGRRFLKHALLVVGILFVLAYIARWQVGRVGQRQLNAAINQLDSTEPGWRLEDIETARRQASPPPEINPATVVLQLSATIPPKWQESDPTGNWDWGPVTNYHPSFFELMWLAERQKLTAPAREKSRQQLLQPDVFNCPRGHYEVIQKDNPIMTLLPHIEKARNVLSLLEYDSKLSTLGGQANRGISTSRACLVIGRSIGDEPYLISQLVRLACDRVSVQATLQVLAWSEPKEGLAELQKELRSEADTPWFQYGLRGERGMMNKLFDGLQNGTISIQDIEGMTNQKSTIKEAAYRIYKAMLPGDQAKSLEILTAYLEAAKLPPHEQKAALAQIKMPPRPPEDIRYLVTNMMVPACQNVAQACLRTRADLLTGSVAIACERYRIAKGQWPESLAEIPREILPDIPIDPFNGKPIQYRKLEDGVIVFTIGDELDAQRRNNRGAMDPKDPVGDHGRGWKLWNKELRGIPRPLPNTDPQ